MNKSSKFSILLSKKSIKEQSHIVIFLYQDRKSNLFIEVMMICIKSCFTMRIYLKSNFQHTIYELSHRKFLYVSKKRCRSACTFMQSNQ